MLLWLSVKASIRWQFRYPLFCGRQRAILCSVRLRGTIGCIWRQFFAQSIDESIDHLSTQSVRVKFVNDTMQQFFQLNVRVETNDTPDHTQSPLVSIHQETTNVQEGQYKIGRTSLCCASDTAATTRPQTKIDECCHPMMDPGPKFFLDGGGIRK